MSATGKPGQPFRPVEVVGLTNLSLNSVWKDPIISRMPATNIENENSHVRQNSKPSIEFLEFSEEGCAIELSQPFCGKGNNLLLNVIIHTSETPIPFEVTAKVLDSHQLSDSVYLVELKLVQFNKELWAKIFDLLTQRQAEAEKLLARLKG